MPSRSGSIPKRRDRTAERREDLRKRRDDFSSGRDDFSNRRDGFRKRRDDFFSRRDGFPPLGRKAAPLRDRFIKACASIVYVHFWNPLGEHMADFIPAGDLEFDAFL